LIESEIRGSKFNNSELIHMYSKIYALWKKEHNSDEIFKIESDFFKQIENYLKSLQNYQKNLKNKVIKTLTEQKLNNLLYLIEELCKIRIKKSLTLMMNGKFPQKEVLCVEEIKAFSAINDILKNYLENLTLILKGETPQKLANGTLTGDYFIIRVLTDIPQIMGTDLKRYGPFNKEDIAVLPKKNVETLLEHNAVLLIEEK